MKRLLKTIILLTLIVASLWTGQFVQANYGGFQAVGEQLHKFLSDNHSRSTNFTSKNNGKLFRIIRSAKAMNEEGEYKDGYVIKDQNDQEKFIQMVTAKYPARAEFVTYIDLGDSYYYSPLIETSPEVVTNLDVLLARFNF